MTAALDPLLVGEVLQVIRDLAADGMTIVIWPRTEMAFAREVADRVVFLADGRIEVGHRPSSVHPPHSPRTAEFPRAVPGW